MDWTISASVRERAVLGLAIAAAKMIARYTRLTRSALPYSRSAAQIRRWNWRELQATLAAVLSKFHVGRLSHSGAASLCRFRSNHINPIREPSWYGTSIPLNKRCRSFQIAYRLLEIPVHGLRQRDYREALPTIA